MFDALDGDLLLKLGVIACVRGTTVVAELNNAIVAYAAATREHPGFIDALLAAGEDPESRLSKLVNDV